MESYDVYTVNKSAEAKSKPKVYLTCFMLGLYDGVYSVDSIALEAGSLCFDHNCLRRWDPRQSA